MNIFPYQAECWAAQLQVIAALPGQTSPVACLDFSHDGLYLASTSEETLMVWSMEDIEEGGQSGGQQPLSLGWCPGPRSTPRVSTWRSGTGTRWLPCLGSRARTSSLASGPASSPVRVVRFSPNGRLIFTGHDTGTVQVKAGSLDYSLILNLMFSVVSILWRKKPEFFKTHSPYVFRALLVPHMAH